MDRSRDNRGRESSLDGEAQAQPAIECSLCFYNNRKPHQSLNMNTPAQAFAFAA